MMKKLFACTLLAGFAMGFCTPIAQAQTKAEEEAIKNVVLAETDLFFARDFEGWANTIVHVPNTTQVWNNADGTYTHRLGWETIKDRISAFMKNNPEPDKTPMWREDFHIRFYGDAAFVTFVKYLGSREAKPIQELRVVERHGEEWKIVCVAVYMDHLKPAESGQ